MLQKTLKSRQDVVRVDEFRGLVSGGAGLRPLCLVTGFTRISINILQAEKTLIEVIFYFNLGHQMLDLSKDPSTLGTTPFLPSSPQSALAAVVGTLIRSPLTRANPLHPSQKPRRENNMNSPLM